jgi:TRAP-type mannitol/chloroaromatic compound transport system permease small subunit
LSIVGIVFIQLGHTFRAGRITRADNLIRSVQRRWPRIGFGMQAVFELAGVAVFAVLFQSSYPFFLRSWASGEYAGIEGYVTYPVWPVRLTILIGCVCSAIQLLLFVWRDARIAWRNEAPASDDGGSAETAAYGTES